jgi:hypothetical protein
MGNDWQAALLRRIGVLMRPDGGLPYAEGATPAAEPTAYAALALAARQPHSETVHRALDWLAQRQLDHGGVPVSPQVQRPCWTTAPALLAWLRDGMGAQQRFADNARRATRWLLKTRGETTEPAPELYDHDTTLVGWPWTIGTQSWVEPTALAVLALRAAGARDHPRVHEGLRLLRDRLLPAGGWNYGNKRVMYSVLRPFPATTGIALAALSGDRELTDDPQIAASLDYLRHELPRVRAPFSLAWGLTGLAAWDARPAEAADWLAEAARLCLSREPHPLCDALLVIADAEPCPLLAKPGVAANEREG